jgi:hypothetical protein
MGYGLQVTGYRLQGTRAKYILNPAQKSHINRTVVAIQMRKSTNQIHSL